MAQALRRIQKELNKLNNDDLLEEKGILSCGPLDDCDMFNWEAEIRGPEDTPY